MFGILGPLEIGGAPATGGPKQRALLALLLVHAGEPLSRDRIVDELWPSEQPPTANHAVQVYVSRLRKALQGSGADIQTSGNAYRLVVEPETIDARVFEQRLARGRELLAAEDAAAAEATLDAALALWRGPALLDVRFEDFAQHAIARLEELRVVAIEERAEARLRLGRHVELVPELEALVQAEPLRERPRAQLMLALYRSGRQADALASYREGARSLRAELGLEPGPELRRLEAAILRHDDALSAPSERDRQLVRLPAPPTPLLGRDVEVEEIASRLADSARLVTITGPGGIGKTRTALAVARQVAPSFPDGVVFVGLAPVADAAHVVPTIARVVGAPEAADQPDALSRHLGDARMLLVLDNLEHLDEAAADVSTILASCAGVRVLATSRRPLRLYGEHEYSLSPLDEPTAIMLFDARASAARRSFDLSRANEPAVRELCRRLDGLPLAIELVAAQVRAHEPGELLATFRSSLERDTYAPRDAPGRHQTLRAALDWSYALLAPEDARVFRHLGVFAGGFDAAAALEVAGADAARLTTQVEHSLVVFEEETRRYRMLETIRMHALELLAAASETDVARRRHASFFAALVAQAAERFEHSGDTSTWMDALDRDRANVRAALAWARDEDAPLELTIGANLVHFWAVRGNVTEGRDTLEHAIARADPEAPPLARALVGAGSLARQQGDLSEAEPLLARGIELARSRDEPAALVLGLTNLGFVLLHRGDTAGALAAYEDALEPGRRSPIPRDRSRVLNCLADLALREGDHERVEELSLELLPIAHEIGHPEGIGVASINRAYGRFHTGAHAEALEYARDALAVWGPVRDRSGIAWCLNLVAAVIAPDQPETAAELVYAADELLAVAGVALDSIEEEVRAAAVREIATQLDPAADEQVRARASTLPIDEVVELALSAAANGRPGRRTGARRR